MDDTLPILVADAPDALAELCGVNLLERLLRILQRLGFRRAIVFSSTPEIIGTELAKPSWARQEIGVQLVGSATKPIRTALFLQQDHAERFLFVPANVYCDARLLAALGAKDSSAALVDSNPPAFVKDLVQNPCGPALVTRDFLLACSDSAPFVEALKHKVETGEIDIVDAANGDDYIVSMRRRVRRLCFQVPLEQDRRLAERVILDSAQNGTLDLATANRGGSDLSVLWGLGGGTFTVQNVPLDPSNDNPPRPLQPTAVWTARRTTPLGTR